MIYKIRNKGFTLIELILAAGIFSILIVSIISAFHTGMLTYNTVDSSMSTFQDARVLLNRIQMDLKNSFGYFDNDSKFTGQKQKLEFFSVTNFFDENANIYTDICRILYTRDGNNLKRASYRGINSLKSDTQEAEVLSSSVKDITFEYAYSLPQSSQNIYDWQDAWPEQENKRGMIPMAVRIKLSLFGNGKQDAGQKESFEFIKVVPLENYDKK